MRKLSIAIFALLGVALAGVASVTTGADSGSNHQPQPPAAGGDGTSPSPAKNRPSSRESAPRRHKLPCTHADEQLNFANRWAGKSFDGLPLTTVLRRCDKPVAGEPARANFVSFIYGDCTPGPEQGCAPPLEIQSWPASEVTKQMFAKATPDGQPRPHTDTTIAGLPASKYEGGHQLVIFGPRTTVMVFGASPARVERLAKKSASEAGPARLTELARSGLVFRHSCIRHSTCATR